MSTTGADNPHQSSRRVISSEVGDLKHWRNDLSVPPATQYAQNIINNIET